VLWSCTSLVMLINIFWPKLCSNSWPKYQNDLHTVHKDGTAFFWRRHHRKAHVHSCMLKILILHYIDSISSKFNSFGNILPLHSSLLFSILKLLDMKRPIASSFQKQQEVIPMPANCPSFAIMEISENIRAKLYSLFCKLGKTGELPCQCHICH